MTHQPRSMEHALGQPWIGWIVQEIACLVSMKTTTASVTRLKSLVALTKLH